MWTLLLFGLLVQISFVRSANETTCEPLPTQKDTTRILANLRAEMRKDGIGVYVVFSDDEHGSEYTQPYDKRRDWITGFQGSTGTAVITLDAAALWVDSRYFTQAEEELDCKNWFLMRDGSPGVPSIVNWIVSEANKTDRPSGTTQVFTPANWWFTANNALRAIGKELIPADDLVGRIWPQQERPQVSQKPIFVHDEKYAGESVAQKLNRTTTELRRAGATATVISALDEVAWQFNLRGADIPFNPFFKSYAIIFADYQTRPPELFLNLAQFNRSQYTANVRIFDYSSFWRRLNDVVADSTVNKIWISPRVSQAISGTVRYPIQLQPLQNSPIQRIKARKNPVERKGMRECQVRDAVARLKHIGWIEEQLNGGRSINETQSAEQLLRYQQEQEKFQFPSFDAISASGDRAAVVHYRPQPATARRISKDQVYLLDAGGQYLDCTTDITRTHHFGTPKPLEKRAYTRVLQGVLDIADAVFPTRTYGRSLDHLGRMHLYRDGMIFGHSVGHGIGHFLSVHEGPQRIATAYNQYEEPLADGMFISDEPGFYKPNDFGIRIEDDLEVVSTNQSSYDDTQFLRFETITLVPYERSLIDVELLSEAHHKAIDRYHAKVAKILEPLLMNDPAALRALRSRTAPLHPRGDTSHTDHVINSQGQLTKTSPFFLFFLFAFIF